MFLVQNSKSEYLCWGGKWSFNRHHSTVLLFDSEEEATQFDRGVQLGYNKIVPDKD